MRQQDLCSPLLQMVALSQTTAQLEPQMGLQQFCSSEVRDATPLLSISPQASELPSCPCRVTSCPWKLSGALQTGFLQPQMGTQGPLGVLRAWLPPPHLQTCPQQGVGPGTRLREERRGEGGEGQKERESAHSVGSL